MSNRKHQQNYQILITKDQSPTLQLEGGEPMHYLAGALSETLYIYSPAIGWSLRQKNSRIVSVGLGLGYNEILCYALALAENAPPPFVTSLESELWLQEEFRNWVLGRKPCSFSRKTYEVICAELCRNLNIEITRLKKSLRKAFEDGFLLLEGPLEQPFSEVQPYQAILYDAFSSQTCPQLWSREFLLDFLSHFAAPSCGFATYAATGILKRALLEEGFLLEKKKGFGNKRECIFATRENKVSREVPNS